jgi:hypothetical protein
MIKYIVTINYFDEKRDVILSDTFFVNAKDDDEADREARRIFNQANETRPDIIKVHAHEFVTELERRLESL